MNMMDTHLQYRDGPPGAQMEGIRRTVVFGNGMLPLYRHGDVLIVSETAPINMGDRVILQTAKRGTIGGTLIYRDKDKIVVGGGGLSKKDKVISVSDVEFVGRVIWASQ